MLDLWYRKIWVAIGGRYRKKERKKRVSLREVNRPRAEFSCREAV